MDLVVFTYTTQRPNIFQIWLQAKHYQGKQDLILFIDRKCYRVEHDETGAIKLTFVGDYPVPYPYEYIKIPQ